MFIHIPKTGGTSIRGGRQIAALYELREDWKQYPSFAVVRNPYDRIESCWRDFYYLRGTTKLNFEDFIVTVNTRPDLKTRIGVSGMAENHAAPMSHPVHGITYVKNVLRYETLQGDFDDFCEKNGLSKVVLPRLNTSNGTPRCEWTQKAKGLVKHYYAEDIRRWYN